MNIEEQIERDEFSVKLSLALKSICPTESPFPRKPEIQVKKKIIIETRDGKEFTIEEYETQRRSRLGARIVRIKKLYKNFELFG